MSRNSFFAAPCLCLLISSQASGISITTNYTPLAPDALNPAFDLGGTQLQSIFAAVDLYYTDIFEDVGHSLTINYWYADLPNLGDHDLVTFDINDRENFANIRIDTNSGIGGALRNYFFDPTPTENEEFTMTQTLWRDIGGTNQTDWFNPVGTIPDTFETSFTGVANGGGPAAGLIDIFSLTLHETGHALGMSGSSPATVTETSMDSDYDFNSNFIFGANLAASTSDQSSDAVGHLDNPSALMFPNLAAGRLLPSHADLLSMASGNVYLTVDVPRREFYGGGDWNNDFNWTGTRDPDSNDDAFVRDSQGAGTVISASLSANGVARNLQVSEGANVDVNSFKLDITQDVTVTGLDSDIFINAGGELEADEAFIQDQAEIQMTGGLVDVRRLTIDVGTQLEAVSGGAAMVDVSERLVNNGIINVDTSATITFDSVSASAWDLDGTTGDGELFANGGNLIFDTGGLTDAFDGTMTIGDGYYIRIDAAWTLGPGGLIDMNGGNAAIASARVTGGTMTINGGTVDVDDVGGDGSTIGQAQLDASVSMTSGTITIGVDDTLDFDSTAVITGGTITLAQGASLDFDGITTINGGNFTLQQDASLDFNGVTTITGGTFNTFSTSAVDGDIEFNGATSWSGTTTINGIARQDGAAFVINPAVINADVFDMDGTVGASASWTLSDDLTINADAIDTTAGYNGTININDGFAELTINTASPWIMAGTLNVTHGVLSANTSIEGQDFTLAGTANIDAWTGFDTRVDITGDIVFQSANTVLSLRGGNTSVPNTIDGGTISGPGRLSLGSNDALVGNGLVTPSEISLSFGARLLASGGQLLINSSSITSSSLARIGTNDPTGTLFINGTFDTSVVQALELNGGFVAGDGLSNSGTTTGHGTITTDGFNNRGLLSADGGTLVLANPAVFAPDLDGSTNAGVIVALNGSVRVDTNFPSIQNFNGTLNVGNTREFRMLFDGLHNTGQVTLAGGSYVAPLFVQSGNMAVQTAPSTLESDSIFNPASSTIINADLSLIGNTDIEAGASFIGPGNLINATGSLLKLKDGSEIGVELINSGGLEVGNSVGVADILAGATFTATSHLTEELEGTALGTFDRLELTEDIVLDGSLRIIMGNLFMPMVGDFFDIIEADLGVSGAFSNISFFSVTPNVGMSLHYRPTTVRLLAGLIGDLNFDGFVGIEDLNIVLGNWNQNVNAGVWGDGDPSGDGFIGIEDLNVVLSNWNTGTPPNESANIPEPASFLLLAVGGLSMVIRCRGRC
jgi:hypothetical protein